jgi:hypothetical protein
MNRRKFLKGVATGIGTLATYGLAGGLYKFFISSEEEATRLHPNERNVYENLRKISWNIDHTIDELIERTYIYFVISGKVIIPVTTTVYPNPVKAKRYIDNALNEYKLIENLLYNDANNIEVTLIEVYNRLPNKEVGYDDEIFKAEREMLRDVLNQSRKIESKYKSVLYKEMEHERNYGIAEIVLRSFGIIGALILWLKNRKH